jgi:NADPH2 dehydrogenase
MKFGEYPELASFGSVAAFRAHLDSLGIDMPCDDIVAGGSTSLFAAPMEVAGMKIGNRLALNPMEGWDGERDGRPSENTLRRWRRFGASGGKLVWGGEAVAVRPDGRANPNQLVISASTQSSIARLREALVDAHREAMGGDEGLVIGLQLTHSGRFCKPDDHKRFEPVIAYRHPLLDRKFGYPEDRPVMSDDEIRRLVDDFVTAAKRARECGFDFVDIKHCHGYLAHEFLSAHTRPGPYGGSLENRTRFLREVVSGTRAQVPGLGIGVRLSAADIVPFRPDPAQSKPGALGPGMPEEFGSLLPYVYGFGVDSEDPTKIDLAEPFAFFEILRELDIRFVNVTLASPYYNPHVTRPALYPPSDGYFPPEDPLVGVARHLDTVRRLKEAFPDFCVMGSAYTYLQEFLPNVAQAVLRLKWADFIGLGRMLLAYPELPRDLLEGKAVQRKRLCRSFSDCTTAPRNGLVSGCYPLDAHYKKSEEFKRLAALKKRAQTA